MKRLEKSAELLWLLGIIFVAMGVALCSKADLGVSMIAAPAFVVFDFISPLWGGFSVGMTEYIIQGIMLIILCVIVSKFNLRYILAFAVAVIYGYTLNLFLFITDGIQLNSILMRYILLFVGDIITALGVACFFRTYLSLQVYELFVTEIANKFKFNITKTKWIFDLSLLTISVSSAFLLLNDASTFDWSAIWYKSFHSIGPGTVITTIINSPLIALTGKCIDKLFGTEALFPKLKRLLKG